ncbi:MAG TPA: 50S ribosomal protein L10 [Candidatus Paceibacterota bacterium]
MPKSKAQKQEILNSLQENLDKQKAIVFVDYKGLKVGDMVALRNQLKEVGSRLVVAKKTLLSKALKEKRIKADIKGMNGQMGAVFAYEDPIVPMKTVHTFGKQNEHVKILGGYFENEIQSASQITAIATLPSREQLLGQLVGAMAQPISGFATVLQGNIKGLVIALNAIKNKQA